MGSVVTPIGKGRPSEERSPIARLLMELIRGLDAYRREVRLYAAGHPRLEARLGAIHSLLSTHLDTHRQPVILQVRGGTLYTHNLPIDRESGAAGTLASLLKERMIQLVEIQPGVDRAEITAFAHQLVRDEPAVAADASQRLPLGDHMMLHLFEPTFHSHERPLSQEEILARAAGKRGTGGGTGTEELDAEEWRAFGSQQLDSIAAVLADDRVRSKLRRLQESIAVEEEGKNFLPLLFTTLKKDPRTDWGNLRRLADLALAGLSLIEEGKNARNQCGALPTQLLAHTERAADALNPHTRWLLLRNFFPGMTQDRSPREAEDLSFLNRTNAPDHNVEKPAAEKEDGGAGIEQWALDATLGEDWGKTDPRVLEKPLEEQFQPARMLGDCAAALVELARCGNAIESAACLSQFQEMIERELGKEAIPPSEVEHILVPMRVLDEPLATQWRLAALRRAVRPGDVLAAVAGGDPAVRRALVEAPGALRATHAPATAGAADRAWDSLKRLLLDPEYPSLAVAHSVLADGRAGGPEGAWGKLARELTGIQQKAGAWVEERLREFFEPHSIPFLLSLPPSLVSGPLIRYFNRSGVSSFQEFLDLFRDRPSPEATQLIVIGFALDAPSARLATIRALGRQRDSRSLQVLIEQLRDANLLRHDGGEVAALVSAIRSQSTHEARQFLLHVLSARGRWWLRRWRRGIRSAARKALASWGEGQPS